MTGTRKLARAKRKAERATNRLDAIESRTRGEAPPLAVRADEAEHPTSKGQSRRRRSILGVVSVFALGSALAAAWFLGLDDRYGAEETTVSARTSVEEVRGVGRAVVVRDGTITVQNLAIALTAGGAEDLVTVVGDVATVATPLVVEQGASLEVHDTELRLLSTASVVTPLEVRGGRLDVDNSTITSWDDAAKGPDLVTKDGRASVLISGGGSADVDASGISFLGYEASERHGFSLIGGGTRGVVTNTRITGGQAGITVSGDVDVRIEGVDIRDVQIAGIELAGTTGVSVTGTSVQGSAGDGIVVLGSSSDVQLKRNDVFGNKGTGLALLGSGGEIRISKNYSHRNDRAGITVSNTRGALVTDNKIWGNSVGVSLVGGNSGTVVRGNSIGGNRGAGVESTSAGNTVVVADNVIDHNEHGVVIADGTIEVRGNTITDNTWGVAVLDKSPRAVIRDNKVTNSADGAVRIVKHDGVEIAGNTLTGNRMAPFIVDVADDSLAFQDQNSMESGRMGSEWIYEPLRDIGELADVTPVPAEFFTQPNVQFLLPEDQVRQ